MKYLLIDCGCAECRWSQDEPLIQAEGPFDTIEEAKAACWSGIKPENWKDHPQGGVFNASGQGDVWIFPVPDGLEKMKEMPE